MTSLPTPESVELLPCPFCGESPHLHECDWSDPDTYTVHCGCGAMMGGTHTVRQTAIKAWNRRAQLAALLEQADTIAENIKTAANMMIFGERCDEDLYEKMFEFAKQLKNLSANTIEQQAAEIERLKEENKALGIADAHHFDEYAELKARAEAAEARCTAMEKLNDILSVKLENRTNLVECLTTERDEARVQVTALTAENAVLRSAIEYAHSEGFHWPTDPLSTPNTKAMMMVEVVKAGRTVKRIWMTPRTRDHELFDAIDKLCAAIDGDQG